MCLLGKILTTNCYRFCRAKLAACAQNETGELFIRVPTACNKIPSVPPGVVPVMLSYAVVKLLLIIPIAVSLACMLLLPVMYLTFETKYPSHNI